MSRRTALRALGSAGAAAWVAPTIVTTDAAAAASALCLLCGENLVLNPSAEAYEPNNTANAEYDPNTDPVVGSEPGAVPSLWTTANGFRVITYGSVDYPDTAPTGAGAVMFSGSLDAGSASPGTATQTSTVAACAPEIDANLVSYTMSAVLGGQSSEADTMQFVATFLDEDLAVISSDTLGPVAASAGFALHDATGTVPPLTRFIRFELIATKLGPTHARNTGAADLLSFVLC